MSEVAIPEVVSIPAFDASIIGSARNALAQAKDFIVDSDSTYELAAEELRQIKTLQANVEAARTELKKPILEAGRGIDAFFKAPADWLKSAEQALKQPMIQYAQKKEAERQAEMRKAAEEVERQKRELAAEAEKQRAQGNEAVAAVIEQTAPMVAAQISAVSAAAAPKISGVSTKKEWKVEIFDKQAIIKFIADHPEFLHWADIKEGEVLKFARAMNGSVNIDGVRVSQETNIAARRA